MIGFNTGRFLRLELQQEKRQSSQIILITTVRLYVEYGQLFMTERFFFSCAGYVSHGKKRAFLEKRDAENLQDFAQTAIEIECLCQDRRGVVITNFAWIALVFPA